MTNKNFSPTLHGYDNSRERGAIVSNLNQAERVNLASYLNFQWK